MNLKLGDIYVNPGCISGWEINRIPTAQWRLCRKNSNTPVNRGYLQQKCIPSGHIRKESAMITVNKKPDLQQVFSELLLIGSVFSPSGQENEQLHLQEILEKCGFIVTHSECTILEKNKIGDSLVTIARYSLEYRETRDPAGKTFYFEGDFAMQVDRRGHVSISISAKPGISPPGMETFHANGSLIGNTLPSAPFISPPPA